MKPITFKDGDRVYSLRESILPVTGRAFYLLLKDGEGQGQFFDKAFAKAVLNSLKRSAPLYAAWENGVKHWTEYQDNDGDVHTFRDGEDALESLLTLAKAARRLK